jgi:hypothetical protein
MPRRLKVELPVCPRPDCSRVGKLPVSISRKDWCNGGIENHHKAVKMVPVLFTGSAPAEAEAGS